MPTTTRRPVPLSDEYLDVPALAGNTTLLGRTAGAGPQQSAEKKPAAGDAAAVSAASKVGVNAEPISSTPSSFKHLITPAGCTAHWCFTPLATPSPSSRFSEFEKLFGNGLTTPGSKTAFALAQSFPSPKGLFAGPMPVDLSAAVAPPLDLATLVESSPSAGQADSSLAGSPVSFDERDDERSDDYSEDETPELGEKCELAPRPPPGALHPSVGSAGHATGACKRCCFFPRGRCANGYDCGFCHYEHEKRKRKGKKAAGRRTTSVQEPVASQFGNAAAAAQLSHLMAAQMAGFPLLAASQAAATFQPSGAIATAAPMLYGATVGGYATGTGAAAPMMQVMSLSGGGCCLVQQPQMVITMQPQEQQMLAAATASAHMPAPSHKSLGITFLEPPPPPTGRAPGNWSVPVNGRRDGKISLGVAHMPPAYSP